MTYYVDFGPEGSTVREGVSTQFASPVSYLKVGQYVIFETEPPAMAKYRARTIIRRMMDGKLIKIKGPADGSTYGQYLTAAEEKELLIQIIKSVVWSPRSA